MIRCNWPNLDKSVEYQTYHDTEWGEPSHNDNHLFEMLVLESFHCGLSWLIILKKREAFRLAFDNFDATKIAMYNEGKVAELMANPNIVRNKLKILATIQNAKAYLSIVQEYGSLDNYLWGFVSHKVQYLPHDGTITHNALSDTVAKDLKKKGFKFMGTVTTFSYLEAVGIMNNHAPYCFKHKKQQ